MDSKSGYNPSTKTYASLRPPSPLPPLTHPLSLTSFVFSIQNPTFPSHSPSLVDLTTNDVVPYSHLRVHVTNLSSSLSLRFRLPKGSSAFVVSPNSVRVPVLYLALLELGVVVSPSNPVSSKEEIRRQVALCKPAVAFVTAETRGKVAEVFGGVVVVMDSPEFDAMVRSGSGSGSDREKVEVAQSDAAAIMYSSGTTGKIKGVVLTHRNLIATIAAVLPIRPVRTSPAVALCTVPYFHIYGFVYCLRSVAFGETVASMKRFDLRLMMRGVEELKVTQLAVAPPVVVAVVNDEKAVTGCDWRSLEFVFSGGAPLTMATIEKFQKKFPNVPIVQAYGLTETTGGISRLAGQYESNVVGSVGRLVSNTEAKIVDPETGFGLPPMKSGELWVRGPYIMKGYIDDELGTATILDSEGWLKTGDLCYIDNEGFLFYVDRLKELIKYKGYQVPPAELEHILQSHPDIVEAAVIPYPDDEAGQVPMAFVVRRLGSNTHESDIKDFVAKQVAPFKKIRRVRFVDSIPKNAPGKVLRKELIRLALSSTSKL